MASTILEQILENVENGSTLPATAPVVATREALIASALGELDGALERLVESASDLVHRYPDRTARDLVRQLSLAMREGLFDEHPTEMVPRARSRSAAAPIAPASGAVPAGSADRTPMGPSQMVEPNEAGAANPAPVTPELEEPATETIRLESPPNANVAPATSHAEPSPTEVEEALDRIFGVDADAGADESAVALADPVDAPANDLVESEANVSMPEASITIEELSAEALALAQRSREGADGDPASEDSAKLDQILEALAALRSSARPSTTGIDPAIVMQQIRELSLKLDRVSAQPGPDREASGAVSSTPAAPRPRVAIGDVEGLVDFLNSK